MSQPVKIVAVLRAHPDKSSALLTLLESLMVSSRKEPGNLRWDIWQDRADPTRFVLDELYLDSAAVESHRETAHFKHYLSRIADLAERTAYVLDSRNIQ